MNIRPYILGIILASVLIIARLIPHAPNFAPVSAVMVVAPLYLIRHHRWFWPFAGLVISDLMLGLYSWPIMLAVYGCYGFMVWLASVSSRDWGQRLYLSLVASVIFFIITNLAVWQFGSLYPHTWSGLLQAYIRAIPFFRMTFASDIFFIVALSLILESKALSRHFFARQAKKMVLE